MTKKVNFIGLLADDEKKVEQLIKKYFECMFYFDEGGISSGSQKDLLTCLNAQNNPAELIDYAIKLAIDRYSSAALTVLQENFKDQFAATVSSLTPEVQTRVKMLLSIPAEFQEKTSVLMSQFSQGFGRVDYDGALLTVAQIRNRKESYDFNPTVLKDKELEKFIEILSAAKSALRERFICRLDSGHWLSGDIEINDKQQVKIVIFDGGGVTRETTKVISQFKKYFPDAEVFSSELIRQRGFPNRGCFFYALMDAVRSYRFERNRLEVAGHPKCSLFDYFIEQKQEEKTDSTTKFKPVRLPLAFLLEMKSNSVRQEISARPSLEQNGPVKKNGKKSAMAVEEHFYWEQDDQKKMAKRNKRIDYILSKTTVNNFLFIWNNIAEQKDYQGKLECHTLEGLRVRIAAEKTSDIKEAPVKFRDFKKYYSIFGLTDKPALPAFQAPDPTKTCVIL